MDGLRDHEKERAASRYERLEELGRGAMAVVYRARDRQLDRFVAVKVLHEERSRGGAVLKRFSREAAAAARLSHPNIIAVHDAGEEGGRPFIVMELVEGRSLAEVYVSAGWDLRKKVEALRKVALAVQHAHEHGVVHRDLKPANIMVDAAGEPRVSDFGLAHLVDSGEALTRTGAQLGTPVYMAPEQALGRVHDVDGQSDVWALGVMLYEAVAGTVPFLGGTMLEVFHKITGSDPAPVRTLNSKAPRDLETIAFKAMEKEKRRRTGTAGEFAADLGRWLAGEPIQARPVGTLTMLLRRAGRHRVAALAAALAIAAAAGWAAFARAKPKAAALEEKAAKRREADRVLEAAKKHHEDALVSLYNERAPMDDLKQLAARGAAACDAALAVDPGHEEAVHLRGRLRLLAGDEAGAEADFTKAAAMGVRVALLDRGRLRLERYTELVTYEQNRRDRERLERTTRPARDAALADLEAAAAAGLGGEDAAYAEALVAVLEKRSDAKERCERFLGQARRKELAHWLMGAHLLDSDPKASESSLSEAIRWRGKWDRGWFLRGTARAVQGRCLEAMEDYRRAIELNPGQVIARVALGYLLEIAGDGATAERMYKEGLALAPGFAPLHLNLGNVWAKRGELARAIEQYERALKLDPGEVRAVLNIARARQTLGDPQESIRLCDEALAIDPACGTAYAQRGQSKRMLGDREGARADFRKGVEVEPRCLLALEEMGQSSPTPREAVEWFTKAMEAAPGELRAQAYRGSSYCQMGRFDEAERDFAAVLAKAPRQPQALRGRGTLRFERGQFEPAIEDFTAYLAIEPEDEIGRYMRGGAYVKLSRWKEAEADWEKIEKASNPAVRQKVEALLPEVRRRAREKP
jgi:serine/threonine-protein kinase